MADDSYFYMADDNNDNGIKCDDNHSPITEEEIIVAADERGRTTEINARVEESDEQIPIIQGITSPTMMYMTVRVQVPYEELLPGNKMIVHLPGRQNHLPFEVVVPQNIEPGTIISVQVPKVEENEEEMTMMMHPDPQPADQYHQQEQQQQKKEQKRQVPPTTATFTYTTPEQIKKDAMKQRINDQKGGFNGSPEQITHDDIKEKDPAQDTEIEKKEKEGNMVPDRKRELPTTTLMSNDTSSNISKRQKTHCITQYNTWDQHFEELLVYIAKYGDVIVKDEHRQEYHALHKWIYHQRYLFNSHQMQIDRFDKLNNVGFKWVCGSTPQKLAVGAAAMAIMAQARKKILETEQECKNEQERTNAESNRKSTERDKQKNAITCTTTTTTTVGYVCHDCHQCFPSKSGYEYHINNYVCIIQRQRAVWRAATTAAEKEQAAEDLKKTQAKREGKGNKRKIEKKDTKEKQVFKLQKKWNTRLCELKEYALQNNGCTNVPNMYEPNQPLASWVRKQREEYRILKNSTSTKKTYTCITTERIEELNNINFQWMSFKKMTKKGGYAHTEIARNRISAANTGNKPWNCGKNRSDTVKAKIAAGVNARNREKLLAKLYRLGMTEAEYNKKKKEIKYLREQIRYLKKKIATINSSSNNNNDINNNDNDSKLSLAQKQLQELLDSLKDPVIIEL